MGLADEIETARSAHDERWDYERCEVCTIAREHLTADERNELLDIWLGLILHPKTRKVFTDHEVAAFLGKRSGSPVIWYKVRNCRWSHHGISR